MASSAEGQPEASEEPALNQMDDDAAFENEDTVYDNEGSNTDKGINNENEDVNANVQTNSESERDDNEPSQQGGGESNVDPDSEDDGETEFDPPVHRFDDDIENEQNEHSSSPSKVGPNNEEPQPMSSTSDPPALGPSEQSHDSAEFLTTFLRNPSSVPRLVTTTISELNTNGPGVLASLLSLIVGVARPTNENISSLITPDMVVQNEPPEAISQIVSVLTAETHGRVPVLSKDTQSKRIQRSYEDFWRRFSSEAGDAVIYDTDCFETIISWLEAMASVSSRGLRAAACIAAYRIVDGLITFGTRQRKQLASLQRQFSTEKTKCGYSGSESIKSPSRARGKALSAKGKELKRKVEDLAANESELTELCDKIFRSVFIIKFRDVAPEIRILSVKALSSWILMFPQHFLDDVHNKYIGWLLFDKDAGVRKASLEVLRSMLQKKDFFPSLELFLQRFRGRVVEMSRDRDDNVAIAAIHLLTCLVPYNMLEQENCEAICTMAVEESHVELRRAAGQFLSQIITLKIPSNPTNPTTPKRGRGQSQRKKNGAKHPVNLFADIPSVTVSREHIMELLYLVADKDEESVAFAVDAVWDHLYALRCWEAFDDLLIEKNGVTASQATPKRARGSKGKSETSRGNEKSSDTLKETDKAILCEMMASSAREISGQGLRGYGKQLPINTPVDEGSPAADFSRHVIDQLPKLLTQFQADARAMKALVTLPRYFSTAVLEREGREEQLRVLLDRLIDALTRHTARTAITIACAETLRVILADDNPLKLSAVNLLQIAFKKASDELGVAVLSGLMDTEPDTVSATLLRARVMGELVEPNTSLYKPVVSLLEYHLKKDNLSALEEQAISDAVRIAYSFSVWGLLKIRSRMDSMRNSGLTLSTLLSMDDMKEVQIRGSKVVDILIHMCSSNTFNVVLKMISLQGLLTTLTLCRGIERLAEESMSADRNFEGGTAPQSAESCIDLLLVKSKRDLVAESVSRCTMEIVAYEQSLAKKKSQSRGDHQDENLLSAGDLKDFFAALVQASMQSSISLEICHLPLLGLTLKGKRSREVDGIAEVSILTLCRQYYERRIVLKNGISEQELRVLVDCDALELDNVKGSDLSCDAAEAMVALRHGADEKSAFAVHIIAALRKWVVEEDEENVAAVLKRVNLLCSVGTALLGVLNGEGAKLIRQKIKQVEAMLNKEWLTEESGAEVANLEGFMKALEVVEKGLNQSSNEKDSSSPENAAGIENQEEGDHMSADNTPATVLRKSMRGRRRVNYALFEDDSVQVGETSNTETDQTPEEETGHENGITRSEGDEGEDEVNVVRHDIEEDAFGLSANIDAEKRRIIQNQSSLSNIHGPEQKEANGESEKDGTSEHGTPNSHTGEGNTSASKPAKLSVRTRTDFGTPGPTNVTRSVSKLKTQNVAHKKHRPLALKNIDEPTVEANNDEDAANTGEIVKTQANSQETDHLSEMEPNQEETSARTTPQRKGRKQSRPLTVNAILSLNSETSHLQRMKRRRSPRITSNDNNDAVVDNDLTISGGEKVISPDVRRSKRLRTPSKGERAESTGASGSSRGQENSVSVDDNHQNSSDTTVVITTSNNAKPVLRRRRNHRW